MTQATLIKAASATTPPTTQLTTTLAQLQIHVAHDRTQYDLAKLAGLTLQVVQRSLDDWQPVTAAQLMAAEAEAPDKAAASDSPPPPIYGIVSGHRRWLARILAHGVQEWSQLPQHKERVAAAGGIDLAFTRELLVTIVEKFAASTDAAHPNGDHPATVIPTVLSARAVHHAAQQLLQLYGGRQITIALFQGDAKAQALALQAANSNREDPDPLGLAHSYQAAYESGASLDEIARHSGVDKEYVLNHLALTQIPPALAALISSGKIPMGMARVIVKSKAPLSDALAAFVLKTERSKQPTATVSNLKTIAKRVRKWQGLQAPLSRLPKQSQRNVARILAALWQTALEHDAVQAWTGAVAIAHLDMLADPWLDLERTEAWFRALDVEKQYVDASGRLKWDVVVAKLLISVACGTCPVGQLPRQQLQSDIGAGQDGVLGMPCRLHAADEHESCLHGYAASDSKSDLRVPVPFDWGEHPGVVQENGGYVVKTAEHLSTAWEHQHKLEAAAAKQAAEAAGATASASAENNAPTVKRTHLKPILNSGIGAAPDGEQATVAAEKPKATTKKSGDSDNQKQIRRFMAAASLQTHPFATPCASCRHKLDASPVKSKPNAPHCMWAKGARALSFTQLAPVADNSNFNPVLVCRQFAPTGEWRNLIPTHAGDLSVPRSWLVSHIDALVETMLSRKQNYSGHTAQVRQYPLEFLTGRPMSGERTHHTWFKDRFAAEQGNLSDGQIMTLFIWIMGERQRSAQQSFQLPVNGSAMQFVDVKERPLRLDDTGGQ